MEIPILTRNAATTPAIGNGFIFFDSANANALTVKFADCTFKVLSAEPYQITPSQSLLDAQADFLDGLKCALKNGQLTAVEYTNIMTTFQLYYQSNIDVNGNLNQSITTSPTGIVTSVFDVALYSPVSPTGAAIGLSYTTTVPATTDYTLLIDRLGTSGDVTVSFVSPNAAITASGFSYVSNSLGAVTTSPDGIILDGTSSLIGEFSYDGTAIAPGSYVGVLVLSRGSVNKYVSVEITIS